jgi:hypothetical protein
MGGDGVLGAWLSSNPITLAKLCGGAEIRRAADFEPETEADESETLLVGNTGGGPCAEAALGDRMERLVERAELMLVLRDGRMVAFVLAREALDPALGFVGLAFDTEPDDRCPAGRRDSRVEVSDGATLALLVDIVPRQTILKAFQASLELDFPSV